ncbi:MAG: hypothetical protein MK212_14030 [Saprospiraceae bacterium]|nr:hypothetical protein [Saprospiraceae bacterium]
MIRNQYIFYYILFCLFCSTSASARCTSGDCTNGFGHYEWKNGEKYIGNWREGKMFGYGVFYWVDGRKYIGQWQNGKLNGRGTMFYADGNIKSGYWENGFFVRLYRHDYVLSKENLKHAESQLKTMLVDRPGMNGMVKVDDAIWKWLVNKFAGEDIQHKIYWQATSSDYFIIPEGVSAAHGYPNAVQDGKIWVADSKDAEEMWAGVVYELHNIKNYMEFEAIEQEAMFGKCTKDTYVMGYARLEYKAAKETAEFYRKKWKPYMRQKGLLTNSEHWFANIPDTFEEWIALYNDPNGYPWNPYAGYYDRLVRSMIKRF